MQSDFASVTAKHHHTGQSHTYAISSVKHFKSLRFHPTFSAFPSPSHSSKMVLTRLVLSCSVSFQTLFIFYSHLSNFHLCFRLVGPSSVGSVALLVPSNQTVNRPVWISRTAQRRRKQFLAFRRFYPCS